MQQILQNCLGGGGGGEGIAGFFDKECPKTLNNTELLYKSRNFWVFLIKDFHLSLHIGNFFKKAGQMN